MALGRPPPPASTSAAPTFAAPTFADQFLAQVIAQELTPREARQDLSFAAQGSAAYQVTAARAAIFLGPQESVRLVA